MISSAKLGLVILLLLCVITVFVSPFVNLEPSAMRAMKSADLLFAALALAGAVVFGRTSAVGWRVSGVRYEALGAQQPAPDLVKLNCARLC